MERDRLACLEAEHVEPWEVVPGVDWREWLSVIFHGDGKGVETSDMPKLSTRGAVDVWNRETRGGMSYARSEGDIRRCIVSRLLWRLEHCRDRSHYPAYRDCCIYHRATTAEVV